MTEQDEPTGITKDGETAQDSEHRGRKFLRAWRARNRSKEKKAELPGSAWVMGCSSSAAAIIAGGSDKPDDNDASHQ